MITRSILLQMAASRKMDHFSSHNRLAKGFAMRFIASEKMEDVTLPVRRLNSKGLSVSLDYLGEGVTTEEESEEVVQTYLKLFKLIKQENLDSNVSVKLTALGLELSESIAERNLRRLLDAAGPDQFVRIDMEGSALTDSTLNCFYQLWNGANAYRNVGVVIQSYLHRSADDIEKLIKVGARVRLCKGAYKEGPDVAFQHKSEVDSSFVSLMKRLLKDGNYPGIATHDMAMVNATQEFATQNSIGNDKYEFQMLYGVRRELQLELARKGYRIRIYTPFGDHWYPYTMRRLAERPANLRFALASILRG